MNKIKYILNAEPVRIRGDAFWQITQSHFNSDLDSGLLQWTPEVTLKWSTCVIGEQNGSKDPNRAEGDNNDDKTTKNFSTKHS
jgi:hypothetical protein